MAEDDSLQAGLERYLQFYLELTPEHLNLLPELVTGDVIFCDPFNEVCGIEAMRAVFEDMYQRCQNPRFVIKYYLREGRRALVRWEFYFLPQGSKAHVPWKVDGVSELELSEDGKVAKHIDFWDPARGIYQHLPVIGCVLRLIARQLRVKHGPTAKKTQ